MSIEQEVADKNNSTDTPPDDEQGETEGNPYGNPRSPDFGFLTIQQTPLTMTAKEAREKAQKHNTDLNGPEFINVMSVINKAANNGEYSCWFYAVISDDLRKKLKGMGYNVGNTQFDRNETLTKINW